MKSIFSFFGDDLYRVGLALSGGGARGFAHCGALKALEEMGIKPNVLAGVSAGSVVAVMYAAGKSPEEIVECFSDVSFSDLASLAVPKKGIFKMDGFKRFLRKNIPYENLEDLPIPTFIGATDIVNNEAVIFDRGPIVDRIAASCCLPIIFPPQKVDGNYYVDGGVLHNLPAWIIRDKCKYLLGINCSPINPPRFTGSILDVAHRTYNLLTKYNVKANIELCDLVVETTDIAHYKVFDLKGIQRVFDNGYEVTRAKLVEAGFTPKEELKPRRKLFSFLSTRPSSSKKAKKASPPKADGKEKTTKAQP